MKLGFDIHGVIDTFGVFQTMINKLLEDDDVEVHVISGLTAAEFKEVIGHLINLDNITHLFSVTDYLVAQPNVKVWYDDDGLPWADEETWNQTKANYCERMGIDVLFDDSETYVKYFDNIETVYCQVHNSNRKKFRDK